MCLTGPVAKPLLSKATVDFFCDFVERKWKSEKLFRYSMAHREILIHVLNGYTLIGSSKPNFLAIFTLVFTTSPSIPTNVMSYLFLVRGSWTFPPAITGVPGIPGISISTPYLSNTSSTSRCQRLQEGHPVAAPFEGNVRTIFVS